MSCPHLSHSLCWQEEGIRPGACLPIPNHSPSLLSISVPGPWTFLVAHTEQLGPLEHGSSGCPLLLSGGISHTLPLPFSLLLPRVISVTPMIPGMPGHRSIRPYTVFELEQVRQQSRRYRRAASWAGREGAEGGWRWLQRAHMSTAECLPRLMEDTRLTSFFVLFCLNYILSIHFVGEGGFWV